MSCILGDVYVSEAANRGIPNDYIEVYNGGSEECTLVGFQLDDSEELEDFTFGNIILAPGDYWIGFENAEDSFTSGLNADGDIVVFADPSGDILIITLEESIATTDGVELSQSYGPDGTGCYTLPTPGESNADCVEFLCFPGDMNCDGGFNVLDIVALAVCCIGQNCDDVQCDGFQNDCAGDVNLDGTYNVLDIVNLANCVLLQNCGGRVDDASHSKLIIGNNLVAIEADGFIGGVQMPLTHGDDFTIEMTDLALFADYLTNGNETRLLVITPETDDLFTYNGDFEISEIIVANTQNEVSVDLPVAAEISLSDAYPKPFNPTNTMVLTMPLSSEVKVEVYNLLGQVVTTLVSGYKEAGTYNLTWDASDTSSGMYFVKAQADGFLLTQKLILIK